MGFNNLLFKRGYLITDTDVAGWDSPYSDFLLRSWKKETVEGLAVYHDPLVGFHQRGGGGIEVALVGTAIDPVNGYADADKVVERLHSLYRVSEEGFLDYLDLLTGRFVLVVTSPDRSFVLQDAAGILGLFYDGSSDELLVSSHASLIALLTGRSISATVRDFIGTREYINKRRHFPGLTTPHEGVRMLTPNTLLHLPGRTVERFFPRSPLERGRITDELVEELATLFAAQVDMLIEKHKLAVSITGGIDSRLTLASAVSHKDDILCFTYVMDETSRLDAELASRLCDHLGVAHTIFRVDPETCGEDLEEYLKVWSLNTSGMRSDAQGRLTKVFFDTYPADRLHLKSNISEVARAAVRRYKKNFLPNSISPTTLAKIYGINPAAPFVVDAFREYVEITDFKIERTFNYDIYDLFQWEYRMGTWQCLQVMDFDTSHNTVMLYNNRHVLKKMLGVPVADQLRDRLHLRVMESLWPAVLEPPFLKDLKPRARTAAKTCLKDAKYRLERALPT